MDKKIFEKAIELKGEYDRTLEIKDAMEEEKTCWWAFATPKSKMLNENGYYLTERLREKFKKAVDEAYKELEKEIKKL